MTSSPTPPVRILIVDDEAEIRRVLKALLERSSTIKAELVDVPDGESALALLARERFDIVISDYRMRARSGIDVLERAADLYPDSGRILITGYAEIDVAVDAVNRGRVSGFVRKPWDSRHLLTLIESLVPGGPPRPAAPAARSPAGSTPAPGIAQPAPSGSLPRHSAPNAGPRNPARELEDIEYQMRQLRVKFGIGSLSPEGYRKLSDELRQRRAALEAEIFGKRV